MKISVLTILILMLIAGLAMVQMDANTENQIQVLHETEMRTTQGLGVCERVVGPNTDPAGDCADKACYTVNSILGVPYTLAKHEAKPYKKCKGFAATKDCFEIRVVDENGVEWFQVCVIIHVYRFACHALLRLDSWGLTKPFVVDKRGCFGVIAVGGSTSS